MKPKKLFSLVMLASLSILLMWNTHLFAENVEINNEDNSTYKNHVISLDYISRHTNNSKYYINLALQYCDSILLTGSDSLWTESFKERFNLTLSTCDQNINHKIQLFPYFKSIPKYMGFADDVIEYAYDNSLSELFTTQFKRVSLDKLNLTSIIIRDNCDDEMFEIVKQTIVAKTNHYIISNQELSSILGAEFNESSNGDINTDQLKKLCNYYNINEVGIFKVNTLDNINNSILFVESIFNKYNITSGFSESIFTRGFCHDKRHITFFDILLLILESILLITLFAFFEEKIITYKRRVMSVGAAFTLFFERLKLVSLSSFIPVVFSFIMIYFVSYFTPAADTHFTELKVILWFISLTVAMSVFPVVINLFFVNRLDIDGFHTLRGYRVFANSSLYFTYFPFFVFYFMHFEVIARIPHLLLVVLTWFLGDLIARAYIQVTTKSIHLNLNYLGVFGIFLGFIGLMILNTKMLSNLSVDFLLSALVYIIPLNILYKLLGFLLERNNIKKLGVSSEQEDLHDISFISNVINPKKKIFDQIDEIVSDDHLNIMIISGSKGIGKTRVIEEAEKIFRKNNWEWYYGDCDEIQDESATSFEPFVEAFHSLLKIAEFTDRSHSIEIAGQVVKTFSDELISTSGMINDFSRDSNRSMMETCIEITEKIELQQKKTVFVLEGLQWIDPESYAFLRNFIETLSRNEYARKHVCIVLSLRNNQIDSYRGVDAQTLMIDIDEWSHKLDYSTCIEEISDTDFNTNDFIFHLSNKNNKFLIQDDSLFELNHIFNSADSSISKFRVTPLYVLKVLESWIDEGVLKYTPNGYVLSKTLTNSDLPNTQEIDTYFHSILEEFDKKWSRLLESAATIGNKFNAEILAKVWGYELLDVLEHLEDAEEKGLIIDLSAEDNYYKFADKRVVSSIKSYFGNSDKVDTKQIIIEYNKRYIQLHKEVLDNPSNYSLEEVLSMGRRLTLFIDNKHYKEGVLDIIFELTVRLIDDNEFKKLNAFSSFLEQRGGEKIAELIKLIVKIADENTPFDQIIKHGDTLIAQTYSPNTIEHELKLFGLLLKASKIELNSENKDLISKEDMDFLRKRIQEKYKGTTLIVMSSLFLEYSNIEIESKLKFISGLQQQISCDKHDKYQVYIDHLRIKLSVETDCDKTILEKESLSLLKNAIMTLDVNDASDLRLIKNCLCLRTRILSSCLDKKREAIEEHHKNLSCLKINNTENGEWIDAALYILGPLYGLMYFDIYKKETKDYLQNIENFIYKRYNSDAWNSMIEKFIKAKKTFSLSEENLKEHEILCNKHVELISKNIGEINTYFLNACTDYAKYFDANQDSDNAIKWCLKAVNIYEEIHNLFPNQNIEEEIKEANEILKKSKK